jgi:4-hydroxy-tetrahydrodipicolinate synthase
MTMAAIEGVWAAALTPRRLGSQDANLGVAWELLDFLGDHKVDGIVLFGSTGEFVHYSPAERMRIMGLAPKRSRVPILVNVSHSTLDGALELAQATTACGAAGVLLMPPYFFRYDQDAIRQFYVQFAEEAGLDIPTLMYNIPQFSNPIEVETAVWLLENDIVQGVKDSSGDREALRRLLELRQNRSFPLMIGSDGLFLEARRRGASGVVSGIASAIPELLVAINRAAAQSLDDTADRLNARLAEFIGWIDRLPAPVTIKEAALARRLKLGPHASPLSETQEQVVAEFREWFQGWLPVVLNECKRL